MTDNEGTYSKLVEIASQKDEPKQPSTAPSPERQPAEQKPREDLSTTPYISQNYRFTEDELKWLRRQAYNLTERFGAKVSQNTVLRVALHSLRETCRKNPKQNALMEAVSELKK